MEFRATGQICFFWLDYRVRIFIVDMERDSARLAGLALILGGSVERSISQYLPSYLDNCSFPAAKTRHRHSHERKNGIATAN